MKPSISELIIMPSGQERGGSEEALLQYVTYRVLTGVRPRVVVLERGTLAAALSSRGARVTEIGAGRLRYVWGWARAVYEVVQIARKERSDVILSWMTKGHIYGGVAGAVLRIPKVYYQLGLSDGSLVDRISRVVPATGALGCSDFVARAQREKAKHPVLSVPLAADTARFAKVAGLSSSACKQKLGFDPTRPLIGIVGRLQRWKGIHLFSEAMAAVFQSRPDCQAVVVGGPHHLEPEYATWLEKRISSLGLKNKIILAGRQTNVPEWMQAMDVFVHASDREPFGIVVVEAMSLGKPVVATKPGGPQEIIDHGKNGLLVPFGDIAAMSTAILRYLSQPEFAAELGLAAKHRAQAFAPEIFGARVVASLTQLTETQSHSPSKARQEDFRELIITPSGEDRGGAEQSLLQYVRARKRAGTTVTIVALERGFLLEALSQIGADVVYVDAGRLRQLHKWLAAICRIAAEARKTKARLILSWQTKAHLYGSPAAVLAGIPSVYFQRGLPDKSLMDRLCRALPAKGALCCSEYVARLQQEKVSYRTIGIPSPADIDRFSATRSVSAESLKTKFGFPADQPLVGIVGRLQRWKGFHVFVSAMAEVLRRIPDCQAVIVGGPHDQEPDYAPWLAAEIQRRGLVDSVRMVGKQRNIPEWMQAMDVIVHASDREPFGIVVVEAMALGKPVIATKPGGPEEVVEDKKSGLLIPFNDAHALAEAILFYLFHPDVAQQMGEAARERAVLFSPGRYTQNVDRAIAGLLAHNLAS
jgi:glycosyltransferase involved in cell wall biosynthesis